MDGFETVFEGIEEELPPSDFIDDFAQGDPELEPQAEAPEQEPPATLTFKRDHRQVELPLDAVAAIGRPLGLTPEEAVATLQKGCNYDRLAKRAGETSGVDFDRLQRTEQSWVDFFLEHRDLQPSDVTQEMYLAVENGKSPGEVLLAKRLAEAQEGLAAERARGEAARKTTGALSPELPESSGDEFERAFDQALRFNR